LFVAIWKEKASFAVTALLGRRREERPSLLSDDVDEVAPVSSPSKKMADQGDRPTSGS
jgi:hypothetical protein